MGDPRCGLGPFATARVSMMCISAASALCVDVPVVTVTLGAWLPSTADSNVSLQVWLAVAVSVNASRDAVVAFAVDMGLGGLYGLLERVCVANQRGSEISCGTFEWRSIGL